MRWDRRVQAYSSDMVPKGLHEVLGGGDMVEQTVLKPENKAIVRGLSGGILGGLFYIFFVLSPKPKDLGFTLYIVLPVADKTSWTSIMRPYVSLFFSCLALHSPGRSLGRANWTRKICKDTRI